MEEDEDKVEDLCHYHSVFASIFRLYLRLVASFGLRHVWWKIAMVKMEDILHSLSGHVSTYVIRANHTGSSRHLALARQKYWISNP